MRALCLSGNQDRDAAIYTREWHLHFQWGFRQKFNVPLLSLPSVRCYSWPRRHHRQGLCRQQYWQQGEENARSPNEHRVAQVSLALDPFVNQTENVVRRVLQPSMRAPAANKCRADVDTLFHEFGVVRVTMSAEHVYIQLFRPSFLVTGSIHKPNRNFYTRAHMNIYIYIYIS